MKKEEVLRALLAVHPYEEPVFDLYPITNEWGRHGSGVVGVLPEPMPEQEFLYLLKDIFNLPYISHSKIKGKEILDVAICGGSGAFLYLVQFFHIVADTGKYTGFAQNLLNGPDIR